MAFTRRPKKTLIGTLLKVIPAFLIVYFVYHIFQGERGLIAMLRYQKQLALDQKKLQELESKKQILEKQVSLLRPDNLDLDMLEERVREVLNFARPDEVHIIMKENKT